MSKFKVGDRVRCVDAVARHGNVGCTLELEKEYEVISFRPGEVQVELGGMYWEADRFELIPAAPPEPQDMSSVWQVGKTYKTTLEGVTATMLRVDGVADGTKSDSGTLRFCWSLKDGRMCGFANDESKPHLLPVEVATPTEDIGPQSASPSSPGRVEAQARDAAKQLDEVDAVNHPPHYTNHPSGVECITVTEHMNFCRGNAVKYIWRAGEKGDAVEDLRKAVWYLQREIERLERMKGGE